MRGALGHAVEHLIALACWPLMVLWFCLLMVWHPKPVTYPAAIKLPPPLPPLPLVPSPPRAGLLSFAEKVSARGDGKWEWRIFAVPEPRLYSLELGGCQVETRWSAGPPR